MRVIGEEVVDWIEEIDHAVVERYPLKNLVGMQLVIEYASKQVSDRYGEYVIVKGKEGAEYYSFSKLILEQYNKLREILAADNLVRVGVRINQRNQVYFAKPVR